MTHCTHCGAKREGEGKYCGGCGAAFGEELKDPTAAEDREAQTTVLKPLFPKKQLIKVWFLPLTLMSMGAIVALMGYSYLSCIPEIRERAVEKAKAVEEADLNKSAREYKLGLTYWQQQNFDLDKHKQFLREESRRRVAYETGINYDEYLQYVEGKAARWALGKGFVLLPFGLTTLVWGIVWHNRLEAVPRIRFTYLEENVRFVTYVIVVSVILFVCFTLFGQFPLFFL